MKKITTLFFITFFAFNTFAMQNEENPIVQCDDEQGQEISEEETDEPKAEKMSSGDLADLQKRARYARTHCGRK